MLLCLRRLAEDVAEDVAGAGGCRVHGEHLWVGEEVEGAEVAGAGAVPEAGRGRASH